MNGAFAYKQVGEYDKAIAMYELFISKYGSEATLRLLRDGDPGAKPPVGPDGARYEKRVGYLKEAYDALASSYILFFSYPPRGRDLRADRQQRALRRRAASRGEPTVVGALCEPGDEAGMRRERERFRTLGASPTEMAEADFIVASSALKKWDELSRTRGPTERRGRAPWPRWTSTSARTRGRTPRRRTWCRRRTGAPRRGARARAADTQRWWEHTIAAFQRFRSLAPSKDGQSAALGSLEAAMAAEAEYTLIDQELAREFDYEPVTTGTRGPWWRSSTSTSRRPSTRAAG
jgi:hypothetical protein